MWWSCCLGGRLSRRARTLGVLLGSLFLPVAYAWQETPTATTAPATQAAPASQPSQPDLDTIRALIQRAAKAENEQEREAALAELRAMSQRRNAERGVSTTPSAGVSPVPVPGADPQASSTQVQRGQAVTSPGCGPGEAGALDLTPPPPDQPQPRLVCPEPKVTLEPLWANETAVFAFVVRNEGEGPLNIRLRGG